MSTTDIVIDAFNKFWERSLKSVVDENKQLKEKVFRLENEIEAQRSLNRKLKKEKENLRREMGKEDEGIHIWGYYK